MSSYSDFLINEDQQQGTTSNNGNEERNSFLDRDDRSEPTRPAISVEEEHEKIVATMTSTTGQEKDVCYFYLESANWNLVEAIELMQNMDASK